MPFIKIVVMCVFAAMIYGVLHDQVTARICVAYFTIGHPPVIDSESPTLLALTWGVLATWWVGLILGILAGCVSRLGAWPTFEAAQWTVPVLILCAATACVSALAGIAGYCAARAGAVWLVEPLASGVPKEQHVAFLAVLWSHLGAYAASVAGGVIVCGYVLMRRRRLAKSTERQQ